MTLLDIFISAAIAATCQNQDVDETSHWMVYAEALQRHAGGSLQGHAGGAVQAGSGGSERSAPSDTGISYSMLDLTLGEQDMPEASNGDSDADTREIAGWIPVNDSFFLAASFNRMLSGDGDAENLQIGLGAHRSISARSDFYGVIGFADMESLDRGSDSGLGLELGVRSRVSNQIELGASYTHLEFLDNIVSDDTLSFSAHYDMTSNVGAGLKYSTADGGSFMGLSLRIYL